MRTRRVTLVLALATTAVLGSALGALAAHTGVSPSRSSAPPAPVAAPTTSTTSTTPPAPAPAPPAATPTPTPTPPVSGTLPQTGADPDLLAVGVWLVAAGLVLEANARVSRPRPRSGRTPVRCQA